MIHPIAVGTSRVRRTVQAGILQSFPLGVLPILSVAAAYGKLGAWGHVVLYLVVAGLFFWFLIWRFRGKERRAPGENLPSVTFRVAVFIQVLSALFFVAFLIWKVGLPQLLGSLGILLIAAAVWISFGSMVLITLRIIFIT